ncbi:MAG: hypothetical protein MUP52_09725 [Candidatus Aminicenantes bacterium]|nr:hypothetical protein [Candidatus Aminicenantes bacterium]
MSRRKEAAGLFLLAFLAAYLPAAEEDILLRIDGGYLAHSYDHGQIYGEKITFQLGGRDIVSQYLKIDLSSRAFLAYGGVTLTAGDEKREADEFLFDPQKKTGLLIRYKDAIDVQPLDVSQAMTEETRQGLLAKRQTLSDVSLLKIQNSLIYSTAKRLEITPSLEIVGYDVTLFIEGIESIGFKKFKLSGGEELRRNGFSLDKIWFTKSQGLFGKVDYSYEKEKKVQSLTRIYYEEHSVLKNYAGLPRQLDLQTSTTWMVKKKLSLGLAGNYNSTSLWNTRLWFDKKWNNDRSALLLDFSYNKPLEARSETWLGLQSTLNFNQWGQLSLQGKYEVHNQALANLSYNNMFLKKINLRLLSSYSQILIGGTGDFSKIFIGDVNLSYNANLFNAAADYYLNYDLFGNQRLMRPQMRLGFSPVTFYGGLLTATLQNVFIINNVKRDTAETRSYSNNAALNISAKPLFLRPDTSLQMNLALEQFLEKEGRNFTSAGLILRVNKSFTPGLAIEGFYSLQSRRRSKGWLIEGTTSQDLSAVVRVNPADRLNGWLSLSFDPKAAEWKQSFADISIGLVKSWKFQSLLNYDFYRKKINNVDLYLIRDAGRFDLRFIWRSISKQFLVELVPSL